MQVETTRGYLWADQPERFRHVSFSLKSLHVRENATSRARSHSTVCRFVTGSAFFGSFISECQTWKLHLVSSALIPNRSSHPLAKDHRDILWVEACCHSFINCLRGPSRDKCLGVCGSPHTQASVVTGIAISCYFIRTHTSE